MATRVSVQAPKTGTEDEPIRYRCEDCDDVDIINPRAHAKVRHGDKQFIVENKQMLNWYGGIRVQLV